jgi:hypothetical protein
MRNYYATIVTFLFFFQFLNSYGQQEFKNKKIDSLFNSYTHKPREVVYTHLNKSTFIVGEDIGFTAYLYNKKDKKLSLVSKNLYIVIEDSKKNIIKEELLQVKNGVANSAITIDSIFTSGNYKFFAYTNWMKNFKEQNFFVQTIKIIDPKVEEVIENKSTSTKINAQFLPESGHLLTETHNTVGVILKNEFGFGVPNLSGEIINRKKEFVSSFKVNHLGIGRFSFTPKVDENYTAKVNFNAQEYSFDIIKSEAKGVILSLNNRAEKIFLSIATNNFTRPFLKNKKYKLTLHNGSTLKAFDISFNNKNAIEKVFNTKNLTSGINIFTLFDENNNPIAERLFFNYNNIKFLKVTNVTKKQVNDSLNVTLNYKDINTKKFNNISISVLPVGTKSYQHHHNIASYTLLKPYVKGTIENGNYYFKNLSEKKKYALDNLLITQGWSSYQWYDIFNYKPRIDYFLEKGITIKATVSHNKKSKYVMHSVGGKKPNYFILNENEKEFIALNFLPFEKAKVTISKIEDNGKLIPAKLYPQFFPNKIPKLNLDYTYLNLNNYQTKEIKIRGNISNYFSNTQHLDEIVIKSNLIKTKVANIKRQAFGNVYNFTDIERNNNISLAIYLSGKGYNAFDNAGNFVIESRVKSSINGGATPTIYVDGFQILDFGFLSNFDMSIVDYININRFGFGEGIRGGAGGVIKIYTDPNLQFTQKNNKTTQEFIFPLTFSENKKFYVPRYQNYTNDFYKNYGLINWFPINKATTNGEFSFKFKNFLNNNFILFIEGTANDGSYISETKTVVIN